MVIKFMKFDERMIIFRIKVEKIHQSIYRSVLKLHLNLSGLRTNFGLNIPDYDRILFLVSISINVKAL